MKLFLSCIIFCLMISICLGQDFGEISNAELKIDKCIEEPDADVIILFDKCSVKITPDFDLVVNYHKRIKILTEKGKQYANKKITYWHEDIISRLDAICISPEGKEYELDSDNIFEEEGEKHNTISFAIPGVEVGSVIEYEYKHWSKYITRLEPWIFQDENFTKLSELKVLLPKGFNYSKVSFNTDNYDFEENIEAVMNPYNLRKKIAQFTWTGRNISGLKDEPFMDNIDDKYAKTYFILNSYKDRYTNFTFSKTWDDVAKLTSKKYNDFIEQDDETEIKAKELIRNETDKLNIAKLLYNYVKSEIKLTKHLTLYGDQFKDPETVLETKSGSSSDKNMLLINLFTNCGLNVKPVLISTKKNGEVMKTFTERWQFNRLICKLTIDKNVYFLNAGNSSNPFGYLTPSTDVGIGFLIDDDKGKIISLKPLKHLSKTNFKTNCSINDDGILTANTKITYSGYSAFRERNALEDKIKFDIKERVENYLKDLYAGAKLDTFYYSGIEDIENSITLNLTYSLPDYMNESDSLVYLTLPLFTAIKENPFKRDKRLFSVDFNYSEFTSEEFELNLPTNLLIVDVPQNKKFGIRNYNFIKKVMVGQNFMKCNRVKILKKRRINWNHYKRLKKMYERMILSDDEQLVLKKVVVNKQVNNNSQGK